MIALVGSFVSDVGVFSGVSNLFKSTSHRQISIATRLATTSDEYGTFMIAGQQTFDLIYDRLYEVMYCESGLQFSL